MEVFAYIAVLALGASGIVAIVTHLLEPSYPSKLVDHIIEHRVVEMDQRLDQLEKRIDSLPSL